MHELIKVSKIFTDNLHLQEEIVIILKEQKYLNIDEFFKSETDTHTSRVSLLSKNIAKYLGFEEEQAEELKIMAPLHDIGKLLVPPKILSKPSKLTVEEFELIKKHPLDGYNLLMGSNHKIMTHSSKIALEHHEKFDGTGYPFRKKGNQIHIYSRIVAVADVIDSLISVRCYKKCWTKEEVAALLQRESAKHFDPRITNLVLSNFDEILQKTYKK